MPTLVLLHGALGSTSQFEALEKKLSTSFDCHSIEFPLHGNNSTQIPFSVSLFTDYLITTLEERKLKDVYVFGYSLGGYVALCAAYKRPELFSGIITLATKAFWNETIAERECSMLDAERMEEKIPAFVNQLKERHRHINWKELLLKTKELLFELGKTNLLMQQAAHIKTKTWIGVGDKDNMVSLEESIALRDALPNANLFVLPNTKHPFEMLNLNLLIPLLQEFAMA